MRNLIKRISALLLCLLLVLSLPVTALAEEAKDTDEAAAAEEGTTLRILRQKQFLDFAENCRLDSYSRNLSVVLLTDIDLTGVDFAGIPIFCGNFDGNGHTISGLSITQDGSNMGLFRYVDASALIQNLTVSGEIIPDGSRSAVGGIAGHNAGKIQNCFFDGTVSGSDDVGGIAGTMGVENLLDPEEDNKDEGTSLLRTSYTVSAVLTGNINEGSITAKKDMVGGIVGQEELGLVTACESYGDVTGVNQVGGIAGAASAKLRSNWAKCALSGEKYIGGIVGQGTDSDLTDGSLIAINNRAIVSVLEGQQYVGAVSGGQDGDFYGNLFVSDDLQGIDRLSRVGQAEPVTYETLLAQENVPDSFRKLTLTFKADGHIIKKISFDYGASFTLADYPEIPQKNGYYAEWSTPVLDQLHTDTVVNVEYTPYIPSLSSSVTRENGRPVFFVDGFFGGSNAVQVTQQDITADVHGVTEQWLLEFTDDGNETHQIRYLTPGKAKGKVYVKQADGSWHKVETGSFGSYTTFTTTGTEVEVAFVPAKLPIWAFCAGGAALLVLLLLLAKRIKSKHGPKGEKPLKEKKGKQPETADTPADELDTPISETDMQ